MLGGGAGGKPDAPGRSGGGGGLPDPPGRPEGGGGGGTPPLFPAPAGGGGTGPEEAQHEQHECTKKLKVTDFISYCITGMTPHTPDRTDGLRPVGGGGGRVSLGGGGNGLERPGGGGGGRLFREEVLELGSSLDDGGTGGSPPLPEGRDGGGLPEGLCGLLSVDGGGGGGSPSREKDGL